MTDPLEIRVADADREQLAEELREHMLAGRLTSAEFEDRVGRAYRATTRGQLESLRADLPLSPTVLKQALSKRKRDLRRRFLQESSGSITASAVCVGIWLANGAQGAFWPAWVIAFTLLPVLRDGWKLIGPAPDLDALEASLKRGQSKHLARERRNARRRRELTR